MKMAFLGSPIRTAHVCSVILTHKERPVSPMYGRPQLQGISVCTTFLCLCIYTVHVHVYMSAFLLLFLYN